MATQARDTGGSGLVAVLQRQDSRDRLVHPGREGGVGLGGGNEGLDHVGGHSRLRRGQHDVAAGPDRLHGPIAHGHTLDLDLSLIHI